jgi:hypothetical protein|eukprot:COSAG01_NODE_196_length_22350_cov_812.929136_24_plen_52_part_00
MLLHYSCSTIDGVDRRSTGAEEKNSSVFLVSSSSSLLVKLLSGETGLRRGT